MVGVEAVLVPVLLLERELCHRHGRDGYLQAQAVTGRLFDQVRACEYDEEIISSEELSGSCGVIMSQKFMSSFRPAIAP